MSQSIPYVIAVALAYYMFTKAVDAGFINALKETTATIEEIETGKEQRRDEMMGLLEGDHDEQ